MAKRSRPPGNASDKPELTRQQQRRKAHIKVIVLEFNLSDHAMLLRVMQSRGVKKMAGMFRLLLHEEATRRDVVSLCHPTPYAQIKSIHRRHGDGATAGQS